MKINPEGNAQTVEALHYFDDGKLIRGYHPAMRGKKSLARTKGKANQYRKHTDQVPLARLYTHYDYENNLNLIEQFIQLFTAHHFLERFIRHPNLFIRAELTHDNLKHITDSV